MKASYLISLAVATVVLTGCGGSSSSSDTAVVASKTITVERGPILKAVVVDSNGQKAKEEGSGKYTFASTPSYPVMATGGFIDVDRDGVVSVGDVVNDVNLTTVAGSVVTLATTLASNPKTKAEVERIATSLNITTADLLTKTPSESKEIEAISNIMYKYMKENNITDLSDTQNQQLISLNISSAVATEYNTYVNDSGHDFKQQEKALMDALAQSNPDSINHLDDAGEVSSELSKNEIEHDDIEGIKSDILRLKGEYESEYGDLDYKDDGDDVNHNQGISCATCHSVGGSTTLSFQSRSDENENESGENIFDSGASIFTTINATGSVANAASGYSLRLVLAQSGTIENYRIGRGTGNVNATFNAGITTYTVEVLDRSAKVVNTSVRNSHDASRLDCNRCHTAVGSNGAPGRIVSFKYTAPVAPVDRNTTTTQTDTNNTTTTGTTTGTGTTTSPTTILSFSNDVLPILTNKCASCHGGSGNFSITTSTTAYSGVTPFVNTTAVTSSRLLQKGAGVVGHGGGNQLGGTTSANYITIRDWIIAGALNN